MMFYMVCLYDVLHGMSRGMLPGIFVGSFPRHGCNGRASQSYSFAIRAAVFVAGAAVTGRHFSFRLGNLGATSLTEISIFSEPSRLERQLLIEGLGGGLAAELSAESNALVDDNHAAELPSAASQIDVLKLRAQLGASRAREEVLEIKVQELQRSLELSVHGTGGTSVAAATCTVPTQTDEVSKAADGNDVPHSKALLDDVSVERSVDCGDRANVLALWVQWICKRVDSEASFRSSSIKP